MTAGALLLLVPGLRGAADDPGLGWHLKTGEWIYANGQVPFFDPFLSYSTPRQWIADQWLGDLLLYAVYRAGGWPLLYALTAALFLFVYFVVLYPVLVRASGSRLASAVLACAALKVGLLHFLIRPLIFGFLCFALITPVLQHLWQRARAAESETLVPRAAYILFPALFAAWANLHPSFVIGLAVMALLPAAVVLDRVFRAEQPVPLRFWGSAVLLFVLSASATFFNPNTYLLHRSVLAFGASDFFIRLYGEWQPADFAKEPGAIIELMLLTVGIAAFLRTEQLRRWGSFELLSVLLFFHLALQAVRLLPFAALALALPCTEALAGIAAALARRHPRALRATGRAVGAMERHAGNRWSAGIPLLAAASLALATVLSGTVPGYRGEYGPSAQRYPYQALDALLQGKPCLTNITVLASPDYGGFITWYGGPHVRALLDDRSSLLGEDAYRDYLTRLPPRKDWRAYAAGLGATHLLLERQSAAAGYLLETKVLPVVYQDERFVLFEVKGC